MLRGLLSRCRRHPTPDSENQTDVRVGVTVETQTQTQSFAAETQTPPMSYTAMLGTGCFSASATPSTPSTVRTAGLDLQMGSFSTPQFSESMRSTSSSPASVTFVPVRMGSDVSPMPIASPSGSMPNKENVFGSDVTVLAHSSALKGLSEFLCRRCVHCNGKDLRIDDTRVLESVMEIDIYCRGCDFQYSWASSTKASFVFRTSRGTKRTLKRYALPRYLSLVCRLLSF